MKIPNGWRKVRFGDVVHKVNDKVPNRDEWTFKRYIGGEHFDEGEIRVTRSNPIEGNEEVIGSAFHMRFKPEQVLYVTRNPRLRKGGMVDFEGVCSNVSFVMEADETQLLQSLLPFVIQTEDFVMHTCNNAHGSTNPFLNWKDIAKYEFLLPPLEEQTKISEVLNSIEGSVSSTESFVKVSNKLKRILLRDLLTKGINQNFLKKEKDFPYYKINKEWSIVKLSDMAKITDGAHFSPKPFDKGSKIIGNVKDMGKYGFNYESCTRISNEDYEKLKKWGSYPKKGDVLFSKDGTIGRVFVFNDEKEMVLLSSIAIITPNENIDSNYLCEIFKSNIFYKQLEKLKSGTALTRIVLKSLKNFKFPLPKTIVDQRNIINIIFSLNYRIKEQESYVKNIKNLRNKLSNELLSGNLRLEK
jgi:type I restriction enzyme, S subunit